MKQASSDITGQRFGRLTAVKKILGRNWQFQCDCGQLKTIDKYNVKKGYTRSCGCLGRKQDLTGRVFSRLTVLDQHDNRRWRCQCVCGNTTNAYHHDLLNGTTVSCGCYGIEVRRKALAQTTTDLTGQRFGYLTVIQLTKQKPGRTHWLCRCDCGNATTVESDGLKRGSIRSCGCLQKATAHQVHTTHGLSDSPEYRTWNGMINRCDHPSQASYPRYGGRGIQVCDRWRSFENFYADMGPSHGLSIERRDNDGDYEPNNCYWADRTTQSLNQGVRSDNKTGVTGVCQLKNGRYSAELKIYGKRVLNTTFSTLEEAVEARRVAEKRYIDPLLEK